MNSAMATIILAGGVRRSPLHAALGCHPVTLPIRRGETLLDAWRARLVAAGAGGAMRVVVTAADEVDAVNRRLNSAASDAGPADLIVQREPEPWRGTAGVVRDAAAELPDDVEYVLVVNGSNLPPARLERLLDAVRRRRSAAIVGLDRSARPVNVYAFARCVLDDVSPVGFVDIKEQLLPRLHREGRGAAAVEVAQRAILVRDRESYLHAIASWRAGRDEAARAAAVDDEAHGALISPDATVHADAVVHESAVLEGARLGAGAVVSRSIIGPGATVAAGRRIIRELCPGTAPAPEPRTARMLRPIRERRRRRPTPQPLGAQS